MRIYELPLVNGIAQETTGPDIEVASPATGEVFGTAAAADGAIVHQAFVAANTAQVSWGATPVRSRAELLRSIAAQIEDGADELAELIVREVGKPVREARGEVQAAVDYFTYYASLVTELRGETLEIAKDEEVWLRREPRGVVVAILPWNFPAALVARKSAPALAAGNAILIKPHEETPLSAFWMARAMIRAGLAPGLISILPGSGPDVGQQLVSDSRADLITMTGSVRAGKAILASATQHLTPVSLELGGKAPFIVMEGANVQEAALAAVGSRFANNGQVCICAERIFVQRSISEDFTAAFLDAVNHLSVGDPFDHGTDLGPKVSAAEVAKCRVLLDEAIADGARILLEGPLSPELPTAGHWMAPVVLGDVTDDMRIMREEIFGPVAPIAVFDTEEEVIRRANDSDYGLSSYLFTPDHSQIMRMVRALESGEVFVNRAGSEDIAGYHAGVKQSGLGGDDGPHGFEAYWRKKTVYVRWASATE